MNEQQLYEIIGRKQADYDNLQREYGELLGLVSRIKAGTVAAENVAIDGLTWKLTEMPKLE